MAEDIWNGAAGDGDYGDPKNWSTGSVPGAGDDAVIDADGTVVEYGLGAVNSLDLGALATFDIDTSFTIDALSTGFDPTGTTINAGTIVLADFAELYVTGTLENTGRIVLGSEYGAQLRIGTSLASTAATLAGGGTITLGGAENGAIIVYAAPSTLDNVYNSFFGAGSIGQDLTIQNGGTIDATVAGSVLEIGYGALTNTGLLAATVAGAVLDIGEAVVNAGATIVAAGGTVEIGGGDVIGGTLLASGGGSMFATGGTLDGATDGALTLSASLTVVDEQLSRADNELQLEGVIVNEGTITLDNASGVGSYLIIGAGPVAAATLTGGGTILLSNGPIPEGLYPNGANFIVGDTDGAPYATLDNVDNFIGGEGAINKLDLENAGTIEATGSGSGISFDVGTITNTGLMAAVGAGSTLAIDGESVTNAGGTIAAIGGTASLNEFATIRGGDLTASAGGMFTVSLADLDGQIDGPLTISAPIYVGVVDTLEIAGTIDNLGTISIAGGALGVGFGTLTTATLIGDGSILLQDGELDLQSCDVVGNSIAGSGEVIITANAGTIEASGLAASANLHAKASVGVATGNAAILSLVGETLVNTGLLSAATSAELEVGATLTGLGRIAVAAAAEVEFAEAVGSGQSVTVAGGGTVAVDDPTEFGASLANLVAGTTIDLPDMSISSATLDTTTLTIIGPAFGSLAIPVDGETDGLTVLVMDNGEGGDEVVTISCYGVGTRIATGGGERRIETLRIGDKVRTAGGELRPIVWVGARTVDLLTHPDPALARPVVIRAGAFGPDQPVRDLVVSPDHNIALEDVLIPAKCLVDGRNVVIDAEAWSVTYHHIELATHDLVLAEGLAAETYLDVGNRASLAPGAWEPADFSSPVDINWFFWEALGCRRVVLAGPEVDRARNVLRARSMVVA